MIVRLLALLLFALGIAACDRKAAMEALIDAGDRKLAEQAISGLQRGDLASLDALTTTGTLFRDAPPPVLVRLRTALPPGGRPTLLGGDWRSGGGRRTTRLFYGVDTPARHALVTIFVSQAAGKRRLDHVNVQPLEEHSETIDDFRWSGGSAAGWLVLVGMMAAVGVTVAALLKVWRSGLFRRRWPWTIGCLFGITTLVVSWPGGDVSLRPLSVLLFSAGAFKPLPITPWFLQLSLPLVALIVLFRRRPAAQPVEPEPQPG